MPYFNISDLEHAAAKSPKGYLEAFMRHREKRRDRDHAGMIWVSDEKVYGITLWKSRVLKNPPPLQPSPPRAPRPSDWEVRGPLLWAELHRRALAFAGDAAAERAWLQQFDATIGCGDCREHWRGMMERTPANLSSAAAYYAWTVARHNEVNVRLGKKTWTLTSPLSPQVPPTSGHPGSDTSSTPPG